MKKKKVLLGLGTCVLGIGLLVPSCEIHGINTEPGAGKTAEESYAGETESDPITKLQSAPDTSKVAGTYKKMAGLQLDYAQRGVETVLEYVNIPETIGRSAANVDLEEIGKLLPDDLSTLKRIKPGSDRSAEDVEITLDEELNALIECPH